MLQFQYDEVVGPTKTWKNLQEHFIIYNINTVYKIRHLQLNMCECTVYCDT